MPMISLMKGDILRVLQKGSARSPRLCEKMSDILASCPRAGSGVHRWLFTTALKLHRYCPDKAELARLITLGSSDCGRDVSEAEIDDAVANSQPIAEGTVAKAPRRRWPERNAEQIEAIRKAGPTLDRLSAMSPIRQDDQPHTEEIIDVLFPGNPLICAGLNKESALTRARDQWRGFMVNQQFIVPSPMTARHGKTKDGHDSMRCLGNTGPRRFLIVEFDQGDFDQHAALLIHLAKYAPLVLVVHSGNRSLHGWFYCAGESDEKVGRFFRLAVSLGADPATWTRCQYVRMPDGKRDTGQRQHVVYFNPKSTEGK
jgi:hypothetical protein